MRILRSWPQDPPAGRSHIIDDTERFVMYVDYDYRRLAGVGDDVLLIEWDLAVDPHQLAEFAKRALTTRSRVRVAPYRLYYQYSDDVWNRDYRPVWAHRVYTSPGRLRWATEHDEHCDLFGFGFVYLPAELVARFCADNPTPAGFGDSSFSHWHYDNVPDPRVVIDWDCRPIHLNHPPLKEYIHADRALR